MLLLPGWVGTDPEHGQGDGPVAPPHDQPLAVERGQRRFNIRFPSPGGLDHSGQGRRAVAERQNQRLKVVAT